jgi:DNA-binding GntR family transcriptional regulator
MPKRYGVKEKDQVVTHVINLVMTGKLRSGDRIDRNEIAKDLGLSRVPIQEAMVQLEHDGIVATRYHRGAFVERFDEATLREHHELYGLLNGLASARAATNPTPRVLAELDNAMRALRSAKDGKSFQEACWKYRDIINDEYAGPRLHAAIEASQNFAPSDFWATYPKFKAEFLPTYEDETRAIRDCDPAAARAVWANRAELMAKIMIAELTRRGVLGELRST